MASILDRYGIKEVADVTFYEIDDNGNPSKPILFLDTLKVSTIEQTAETTDARGGKGNPKLITWDYGKEITVNIEDALFSPKSMAIMFGNGIASPKVNDTVIRTVTGRVKDSGGLDFITVDVYDETDGVARKKVDMAQTSPRPGYIAFSSANIHVNKITSESGSIMGTSSASGGFDLSGINAACTSAYAGQKVFLTYTQSVLKSEIVISGDTFPGTYYITGDTYARSDVNGKDQFFQFIIPKAKVSSQNTITLQAEGDPSTFTMNLTVLRPEDGEMMKLVQYDLSAG